MEHQDVVHSFCRDFDGRVDLDARIGRCAGAVGCKLAIRAFAAAAKKIDSTYFAIPVSSDYSRFAMADSKPHKDGHNDSCDKWRTKFMVGE